MPRQDVPYGGAICRLKERIAELFDLVGQKLHSINGVEGDGQGDVKILSDDPAVVITNDAAQNEIKIGLDSSELPSAAVSSVNGETGAVVLDGNDIGAGFSTPGTTVTQALGSNAQQLQVIGGLMQQEILDRQNADSALQTNINQVQAGMPAAAAAAVAADPTVAQLSSDVAALQTADAENVKLAGSQTITGIKSAPTEATGNYSQQIANSQKVKNELDNYAPMVRTTGNQNMSGNKTSTGSWNKKDTVLDKTVTPTTYREMSNVWYDKNDQVLASDKVIGQPNGFSYQKSIRRTINGHALEVQFSIAIGNDGTTSITCKDTNGNYHNLYSWPYTGDLS